MKEPESSADTQEEVFEWAEQDGKIIKITSQNSNGRKCGHCGCSCPCKCKCCRFICCK